MAGVEGPSPVSSHLETSTVAPIELRAEGPDGGDALAIWVAFALSVPLLVLVDNMCLTEKHRGEVSMSAATSQCIFWILTGLAFNLFVWYWLGTPEAISWLSGYVLEYMLSIDNLFCFHLIFTSYRTPKDQTNRALTFGIGGAAVLRLMLFALGASAFNFTFVVHWLFGAVLLWSGFKVMMIEEDDDVDHTENWLVRLISKVLPIEQSYCDQASLFKDVPVEYGQSDGKSRTPSSQARRVPLREGEAGTNTPSSFYGKALQDPEVGGEDDNAEGALETSASSSSPMRRREERQQPQQPQQSQQSLQQPQSSPPRQPQQQGEEEPHGEAERDLLLQTSALEEGSPAAARKTVRKATLLFLVVVTLGAVDLIFALDSVAAKVAMVTQFDDRVDLALNFTSSAFTMLTLRSLYFMLASLVHIFRLMKYGVGVILILIGLRLILQSYMPLSEGGFCFLMLSIFAASILASLVFPPPSQGSGLPSSAGSGIPASSGLSTVV